MKYLDMDVLSIHAAGVTICLLFSFRVIRGNLVRAITTGPFLPQAILKVISSLMRLSSWEMILLFIFVGLSFFWMSVTCC